MPKKTGSLCSLPKANMFPGLLAFRPRYANGHATRKILPDCVGD
ncbi:MULTISPECIES: hypothetical protein [unclassified Moorena]|nr:MULTISPECIES: hypothetical protein [unclassified Moorena]